MVTLETVNDFIQSQWDDSVRCNLERPDVISIPIPHTVPSPNGKFHVLFYWDSYFTNVGLIRSGRVDLARSNCDAHLWWIDQLGFVPNSAFVGDQNRSQPPLLTKAVREVFEQTEDTEWLDAAFPRLEKEYQFWTAKRSFPNGLAHHGHDADEQYLIEFYRRILVRRLDLETEIDDSVKVQIAGQFLAEAETGQDFSPVWNHRCLHFADLELNCLLWQCESDMAFFAQKLGLPNKDALVWEDRAKKRRQLILDTFWDEESGLFRPWDMVWKQFSKVAHLGTFYPLWLGIATEEQAQRVKDNLSRFEYDFGVAQTERYGGRTYQWAFPNGWPPTQWVVAQALQNCGFCEDAKRVAEKYCEAQRRMFESTGTLWEKCDVRTGEPAGGEYSADPMLGWTAGVFVGMRDLMESPLSAR